MRRENAADRQEVLGLTVKENGVKPWVVRHDTTIFLLLTFGISWPLWLASGVLVHTSIRTPDLSWFVAQVGVFAPAFAGMVLGACIDPAGIRRAWRLLAFVCAPAVAFGLWIATRGFSSFMTVDAISTWGMIALAIWILTWFSARRNRLVLWRDGQADSVTTVLWSVGCVIVPTALFLTAWAMTNGTGTGGSSIQAMPVREHTTLGVVAAFAVNLAYGGSLGEEPGWRGAWLPRLLQRHSPFAASLIISFWWALWHAPIDLSQGFGLSGIGALAIRQIWTLPVAVLFTWVTLRAGGSLIPPLILHTAINSIPEFALGQPVRYQRALGTFFVFLLVVVIVAALADSRLRGEPQRNK